jgi:hypothetical protein
MTSPELNSFQPEEEKRDLPQIHNFFELTDQEKQELTARAENFHGTARVFIHPFYSEYEEQDPMFKEREERRKTRRKAEFLLKEGSEEEFEEEEARRIQERKNEIRQNQFVQNYLRRIISQPKTNTPPLLIFEEAIHQNETGQKLSEALDFADNELYFVPTERGTSTPMIDKRLEEASPVDPEYSKIIDEYWDYLADQLKAVGIRKIILGGTRLKARGNITDPNTLKKLPSYEAQRRAKGASADRLSPTLCVGLAAVHLAARGFDIEYSNFASPEARANVKKAERAS